MPPFDKWHSGNSWHDARRKRRPRPAPSARSDYNTGPGQAAALHDLARLLRDDPLAGVIFLRLAGDEVDKHGRLVVGL